MPARANVHAGQGECTDHSRLTANYLSATREHVLLIAKWLLDTREHLLLDVIVCQLQENSLKLELTKGKKSRRARPIPPLGYNCSSNSRERALCNQSEVHI